MKYVVITAAMLFIICSCVTGIGNSDPQALIETWAKGLEEKDLDMLMSTYWPEAEAVYIDPEGKETVNSGVDEIREMQKGTTENKDFDMEVWRQTAKLHVKGDEATCTIEIHAGEFVMTNILELEQREGIWGIIKQVIK